MNKLEKYYNYIVDDLKKNTVILYGYYELSFPWNPVTYTKTTEDPNFPVGGVDIGMWRLSYYKPSINEMQKFAKYIKEKYGAKEEEAETIYNLFKEKYSKTF